MRDRVIDRLEASVQTCLQANRKRLNNAHYKVGGFVLMHRDDCMHQGKLKYEFQGPYEIISVTPEGRFEIRRVGKSLITKAAKEQLRMWPTSWSLSMDITELLDLMENDIRWVIYL